ncbi:membrane protein UL121 [Panine betaherpesvirus 2]|uniref:Membrane protein UL121 n=1 Tax=Panine betaherpesvirus 2 TaxID=188763 RepID=Q8QRY8_9BETA|nr:membrane protein UL121 [Panine betaherpesvirus 2]AAM00750.1 membrane protein UL121 [Panine betaherpesvirus 2]QXV67864.1 membrane protein UL121 [Panine betaherpesvirus 2]
MMVAWWYLVCTVLLWMTVGGSGAVYICSPNTGMVKISCYLPKLDRRLWWSLRDGETRVPVFSPEDEEEGGEQKSGHEERGLHSVSVRHCKSCVRPHVVSLVTPLLLNRTVSLLLVDREQNEEKLLCFTRLTTLEGIRTCRIDPDLGLLYAMCLILSLSIVTAALWKLDCDRRARGYKS